MAHNHNKIILLLMIKNESKIIERCIGRALEHVDAVCILDTGSTDDTVEICNKYLASCGKPFKVAVEPFKNFGHNRSVSFLKAQELCRELKWNPDTTYAMAVDADMIIKPSEQFKNYKLEHNGYTAIQNNGVLKYYNVRFMKCGHNWKCIGATHEYWSGDPVGKIPYEVFYIEDVNDGGCKSDKFERDVRLLTEELANEPENPRTHFYLAQSYKDSGKFEEAIKLYKKRIKLGGWGEEVWYSYYTIGKCYNALKNIEKMEEWMQKAWKNRPWRAEPLYHLTRYFREVSDHHKAYHYYLRGKDIPFPKDDVLFIEDIVYNGLFAYENTILACYVTNKSKQDALIDLIKYINDNIPHNRENVWENMHYYIETLMSSTYRGEYTRLFFPYFEEYHVSSCSIIPYKNRLLLNTRYVNYTIDNKGQYHMRSPDGKVKTKNGMVYLNNSYVPSDEVTMMKEDIENKYSSNIEGLEDLRLFYYKNKLHFSASSKNLTDDGKIMIATGEYIPEESLIKNVHVIQPPQPSDCEKNWIAVPECALSGILPAQDKMNFIYKWHPLQIGAVNENNKLEIHTTYDTPTFFSRFRGSSNMFEYDNKLWALVHFVRYSTPRVYYHSLVCFDKKTMKPEKYTAPFCFKNVAIEYCLSIHIKNEQICFIFSQNDNNPGFITMPITGLRFLNV